MMEILYRKCIIRFHVMRKKKKKKEKQVLSENNEACLTGART